MPVLDIDGTTKNMFGISVGNQRIDIRSNAGVAQIRNNLGIWRNMQTAVYTAAVAPTVNDDSSLGYLVTDQWFDTVTSRLYLCLDTTPGAAVWYWVNQGSGGVVGTIKDTFTQAGHGFAAGDCVYLNGAIWTEAIATSLAASQAVGVVESVADDDFVVVFAGEIALSGLTAGGVYRLSDVTAGLLTLSAIDTDNYDKPVLLGVTTTLGIVVNQKSTTSRVFVDTAPPSINDDASVGYLVKDIWCENPPNRTYICLDNTTGAAVWEPASPFNYIDTVDPTVNDDLANGFRRYDLWWNRNSTHIFMLRDKTTGAAVWDLINQATYVKGISPTVNDDVTLGYQKGDFWWNRADKLFYVCRNNGTGAAIWDQLCSYFPASTTLYIAPTGSDTTGDGSSGAPWATPHKALAMLSGAVIAQDAVVTIEAAIGTYSLTSELIIEHPYGDRIRIRGSNSYTKTLQSVVSSSGAAGNWSIVLQLNNVNNVAVNDVVLIRNSAGAYGAGAINKLVGAWVITNVDTGNSRITITHYGRYAAAPTGAVGQDIIITKSMFVFTTANGITVQNNGSITLSRISVKTAGGYCYTARNGGKLRGVVGEPLVGWGTAGGVFFAVSGGVIDGSSYFGAGGTNNSGIVIWSGGIVNVDYFACGGCYYGALVSHGGLLTCGNTRMAGCYNPLYALYNCVINGGVAMLTDNTGYAVYAGQRAFVGCNSANIYNNPTGIYAYSGAWIYANGVVYSGNTTNTNPVVNTLGNEQAYIDA